MNIDDLNMLSNIIDYRFKTGNLALRGFEHNGLHSFAQSFYASCRELPEYKYSYTRVLKQIEDLKQLREEYCSEKDEAQRYKILTRDGKLFYLFDPLCQISTYMRTTARECYMLHSDINIDLASDINDIHFDTIKDIYKNIYTSLTSLDNDYLENLLGTIKEFKIKRNKTREEFDIIDNILLSNEFKEALESKDYSRYINGGGLDKKLEQIQSHFVSIFANAYEQHPITGIATEALISSNIDDQTIKIIDFSPSSKSKLYVYKDYTSIYHKEGQEPMVIRDNSEIIPIIKDEIIDHFSFLFRKNPTIAKEFKNILIRNDFINITKLGLLANHYLHNRNELKSTGYNIVDKINEYSTLVYTDIEKINDDIDKHLRTHQVRLYAEGILSSKYQHLYNEESYTIFENLMDLNLSKSFIQNNIGRKLAALKDTSEFNTYLQNVLNNLTDFNKEGYLDRINNVGANIVVDSDNCLIVKIDSFEQSKALGSPSWCISRYDVYFNSYTQNDASQYFIFDFNRKETDDYSMIGFTLNKEGDLTAAHVKNDCELSFSDRDLLAYLEKMPTHKNVSNLKIKLS